MLAKPIKQQSTLKVIKITGLLEERWNTGLVIYLVEGGLTHTNIEPKEMECLMHMLQPTYKLKSTQTSKSCLLELYALMKYPFEITLEQSLTNSLNHSMAGQTVIIGGLLGNIAFCVCQWIPAQNNGRVL